MEWTIILLAIGLALLIEGLLYGLFPEAMRRLLETLMASPAEALRYGGLLMAVLGALLCLLALRL